MRRSVPFQYYNCICPYKIDRVWYCVHLWKLYQKVSTPEYLESVTEYQVVIIRQESNFHLMLDEIYGVRSRTERVWDKGYIYDVEICVNGYVSHEEQLDTKTVKLNYPTWYTLKWKQNWIKVIHLFSMYPLSLVRAMTNESFENFLSRPFFFQNRKEKSSHQLGMLKWT